MLHEFSVGDEVTPLDIKDGSETALVEALEESWMVMVVTPQLQAVQMGSKDNSTVHFDLGALFQEFFLFHTHLNSLPKAQFTCASLQSISCQCWHQVQWHTQVSQKSSYQWCKEGTTLPVAMRMGNKSCIVSKEEITDQLLKGLCVDLCWTSSHEMVSGVSSILIIQRYSSLLEYHVKEDC